MMILFTILAIYLISVVVTHLYLISRKEFIIATYGGNNLRERFNTVMLIASHVPVLNLITLGLIRYSEVKYLDYLDNNRPR